MRTFFIGDVHGCRAELEDLLSILSPVKGDRIFQTGDMINRGPDSIGALKLAQEQGICSVIGNHEARLLRLWRNPDAPRTLKDQTFLGRLGHGWQELAEQVQDWPLWIDEPQFTLVHAGLEPGKHQLEGMTPKILLTIRTWDGVGKNLDHPGDPPWFDVIQWPRTVIFGHWALGGLVCKPGIRGLDSGCVYGRHLSAWCQEEDRIYQVPAHRAYLSLN